jgi:hypothetical protein
MAAPKKANPLLSPDHELPAPHDMLLNSGVPSGPKQVKFQSTKHSFWKYTVLRWFLFIIPALLILIAGISIYSLTHHEKTEIPSKIAQVTVTPSQTPTLVPLETSEWKTRTNNKSNYSIKYPNSLRYIGNSGGVDASEDWKAVNDSYTIKIYTRLRNTSPQPVNSMKKSSENIEILGLNTKRITYELTTGIIIAVGPLRVGNYFYTFEYFGTKEHEENEISTFNQILETFTPLDSTISPTTIPDEATMCTMDAKICPDGSSVSRSGPNCEFKACPK